MVINRKNQQLSLLVFGIVFLVPPGVLFPLGFQFDETKDCFGFSRKYEVFHVFFLYLFCMPL